MKQKINYMKKLERMQKNCYKNKIESLSNINFLHIYIN